MELKFDFEEITAGKVLNKQRLYLMEITLKNGTTFVKFGKSSGKDSVDRLMQITRSIYMKERQTPIIYKKKDREVYDVFTKETFLLNYFKEHQIDKSIKFDGSSESFNISLQLAMKLYDIALLHPTKPSGSNKTNQEEWKEYYSLLDEWTRLLPTPVSDTILN